jgi:hypothetical protein
VALLKLETVDTKSGGVKLAATTIMLRRCQRVDASRVDRRCYNGLAAQLRGERRSCDGWALVRQGEAVLLRGQVIEARQFSPFILNLAETCYCNGMGEGTKATLTGSTHVGTEKTMLSICFAASDIPPSDG